MEKGKKYSPPFNVKAVVKNIKCGDGEEERKGHYKFGEEYLVKQIQLSAVALPCGAIP